MIDGIWVTDPVSTWCMLARELDLHDLVAVGDILITDSERTDRRCEGVSLEVIAAACVEWRNTPGAKLRRAAADLMRVGVDSPQESRLRCLLIEGGLPEPTVHPRVVLPDGRELHPDLGYEDLRFGFEYEGGRHADPDRVLADISRFEGFAAASWDVMRATKFDLRPPTHEFLARARQRLRMRREA